MDTQPTLQPFERKVLMNVKASTRSLVLAVIEAQAEKFIPDRQHRVSVTSARSRN